MSLALFPKAARDARQRTPHPLVAVERGLSHGLTTVGKPGGWSRPDFRSPCIRSPGCPAAHPHVSRRDRKRVVSGKRVETGVGRNYGEGGAKVLARLWCLS